MQMIEFLQNSTSGTGFDDHFPEVPRNFTRDNGLRGFYYYGDFYFHGACIAMSTSLGEELLYTEAMDYLNELP